MKILVIQLTRYGDILCSLPILSALRRENPGTQIHFLVRKRFADAVKGVSVVDHLWQLDALKFFKPVIEGNEGVPHLLSTLKEFIEPLRAEKFDKIINLSFSPSSSYITHLVSQGKTPVVGYTRTSDLFLNVPDHASQYFRAQVGLGKSNRIHVVDLFSWIAGVKIKSSDWTCPGKSETNQKNGIVCHLGASQVQKTWKLESWINLLNKIVGETDEKVTLIGSKNEKFLAEKITTHMDNKNVANLVGKTTFLGLVRVIQESRLFIGADSGPLHVANAVRSRSLNLSVGNVRFWETGPTVPGSVVLAHDNPELLGSDEVFDHVKDILNNRIPKSSAVMCVDTSVIRYQCLGNNPRPDFWPIVEWMYFDGPKPTFSEDLKMALHQISELCTMATDQLDLLFANSSKTSIVLVLDRIDELFQLIKKTVPPMAPLLDAMFTQKENIPPCSKEEIFFQTKLCYGTLLTRVRDLLAENIPQEKGFNHERDSMDIAANSK